jgi:hypothetical protein
LDQLEGAFQLLIGGLLTGLIAFCWENFIERNLLIKLRYKYTKKVLGFRMAE